MKNTITTCLGFIDNAEEAVKMYVDFFSSIFGNSTILQKTYFKELAKDSDDLPPKKNLKSSPSSRTLRVHYGAGFSLPLQGEVGGKRGFAKKPGVRYNIKITRFKVGL